MFKERRWNVLLEPLRSFAISITMNFVNWGGGGERWERKKGCNLSRRENSYYINKLHSHSCSRFGVRFHEHTYARHMLFYVLYSISFDLSIFLSPVSWFHCDKNITHEVSTLRGILIFILVSKRAFRLEQYNFMWVNVHIELIESLVRANRFSFVIQLCERVDLLPLHWNGMYSTLNWYGVEKESRKKCNKLRCLATRM